MYYASRPMVLSTLGKLARYAVVGLLTFAIYIATAAVAGQLGLRRTWQVSLAFFCAVVVNYMLQRSWVFGDTRRATASLPKYGVMICVGYLVNLLTVEALASRMPMTIAMFVAVVLVVISNALLAFTWVFLNGGANGITRQAMKKP